MAHSNSFSDTSQLKRCCMQVLQELDRVQCLSNGHLNAMPKAKTGSRRTELQEESHAEIIHCHRSLPFDIYFLSKIHGQYYAGNSAFLFMGKSTEYIYRIYQKKNAESLTACPSTMFSELVDRS